MANIIAVTTNDSRLNGHWFMPLALLPSASMTEGNPVVLSEENVQRPTRLRPGRAPPWRALNVQRRTQKIERWTLDVGR